MYLNDLNEHLNPLKITLFPNNPQCYSYMNVNMGGYINIFSIKVLFSGESFSSVS